MRAALFAMFSGLACLGLGCGSNDSEIPPVTEAAESPQETPQDYVQESMNRGGYQTEGQRTQEPETPDSGN